MTHNDDRPLEGRVIPAGTPVRSGPVMLPAHAPRPGDIPPRAPWPEPDEPGERHPTPPPVTHVHVYLPDADIDLTTVDAAPRPHLLRRAWHNLTRRWWTR